MRRSPRPPDPADQAVLPDMTTLFDRRRLLSLAGLGAGAALLAACGGDDGSTSTTTAAETPTTTAAETSTTTAADVLEIPDETNGPYPADGSNGPDILEERGVVRRDIRSSFGGATGVAEGVPLTFTFQVLDMANGNMPFRGAAVYAWHCDAEGRYSMYSAGVEDENYLRGVQVADDDGNVTFTSIFPACYTGRWPHIHFEVYPDVASITDQDRSISTSQAALPEDACREVYDHVDGYSSSRRTFAGVSITTDGIFDDATIGQQLMPLTGDPDRGYTGSLVVPVDTRTEQRVSMGGGGGGRPGNGPGAAFPAGGDAPARGGLGGPPPETPPARG